jgi:dTDP-4-amino-4,6-dideoxygalactose transaminase
MSKINNFKKIISIFALKDLKNFSCNHLIIANINFNKLRINKKKLFEYLKKANIFLQVNYIPLYKFAIYRHLKIQNFNGAEKYYKDSMSLPIYYGIKKKEVVKVCDNLKMIINKFSYK